MKKEVFGCFLGAVGAITPVKLVGTVGAVTPIRPVGAKGESGMIVVAPIAQIAPIVNGLTDFRINGLTNGMVG